MKKLLSFVFVTFALVFVSVAQASADQVQFNYTAEVTSFTGSSVFGITPTAGTVVTGFFVYESSTADANAADPTRGNYEHTFGGAFRADVNGFATTIEGSATPFVQVEDLSADTFRFIDGASPFNQVTPDGVMSLNGSLDSDIELFLAITDGSGGVFSDDSLPDLFPISMPPILPHTFILNDGTEMLIMQFTSVTPVPEPGLLSLAGFGLAILGTRRKRR